jgi:2Fe-2S ferredoxin
MPSIIFEQPDGSRRTVDAPSGTSVMKAAVATGVPGILAECGGQAMCATCHVYVQGDPNLPAVSDEEDEMLDCAFAPRLPSSRLSCQLEVVPEMDGLVVTVAGEGP